MIYKTDLPKLTHNKLEEKEHNIYNNKAQKAVSFLLDRIVLNDYICQNIQEIQGYINGGVYILRLDIFKKYQLPDPFSFEIFLKQHEKDLKVMALKSTGYFIDIGSPDDYKKAQTELIHIV